MKKESFKFHFNFSILCVKVVTRYTMTGSLSVVLAVVLVLRGRSSEGAQQSYSWTYTCNTADLPIGGHFLGPR